MSNPNEPKHGEEIPWTDEDEAAADQAEEQLAREPSDPADEAAEADELNELESIDEDIARVQEAMRTGIWDEGSDER